MEPTTKSAPSLGIPIAIIIAAALVAGAILYNGKSTPQPAAQVTPGADEGTTVEVLPVTEADHFHTTMNKIMDEYGVDGRVAWVYRQFPLSQLHPNAPKVAEASECVAELGGNEAFWKFSDLVFGERGTNEPTDLTRLPEFAVSAGVDERGFETCLSSGRYTDQINQDVAEAIKAGGQGTPHTVVMVGDQQGVINGAQPYDNVKEIVEQLLSQIEGGEL